MKSFLITGGAGYIGSHTCRLLVKEGYRIVVLDNLQTGHIKSLENLEKINFFKGSIGDINLLEHIFSQFDIVGVVHFAAYTNVGESVKKPFRYYENNFSNPMVLLETMLKNGCNRFVFSSSCAVYGNPDYTPIDEQHSKKPLNPYGRSKFFLEEAVKDLGKSHKLEYVFLRYFNASGASLDGNIGEDHDPETHLIPLVLKNINGIYPEFKIFGNDYPTHDGTCIRDYIHVEDLASAHLKSLQYLESGGQSTAFNLGTGHGHSVLDVIKTAERVTGGNANYVFTSKREGDAISLLANAGKAAEKLGWIPVVTELEEIISSAWAWENGKNKGKF